MKPKKTDKADLRNRRVLFTEIGFAVALTAAVSAFSVGQTERTVGNFTETYYGPAIELPPVTREPEPEPPKMKARMPAFVFTCINQVPNDRVIESEWVFDEELPDLDALSQMFAPEEVVDDIPLLVVSEMPTFQGGTLAEFRNWVMKQLEYPRIAIDNDIQGKVLLKFVVERDGSVSNIEVEMAPDPTLADEAVRVVAMSPKWEPGRHQGKPARVAFILPVDFQLAR